MAIPNDRALPEHLIEPVQRALAQINRVILGKENEVELAFAALLAGGHVLIEDLPGVGKTTLAHALAITMGLDFSRVQFTSDLLPADVLGVSIYQQNTGTFNFHSGPVFAQVVLADELNRATPKTQSALLEAMAEGQVSQDGTTRKLPDPFFVIATQNPLDLVGTYPLPESQLDRFLLNISLGYPSREAERRLLQESERSSMLEDLQPVLDAEGVKRLQQKTREIHASDALLDYIQDLVAATRRDGLFTTGLSPRAMLALLNVSRARAFLASRDYILPEDVKQTFPALARHRLQARDDQQQSVDQLIHHLLEEVAIP